MTFIITNDPCAFCKHITDESDPSVGLEGCGCDSDAPYVEDWEKGCGRPCPGFEPIPASQGLIDQLEWEQEAAYYAELEAEERAEQEAEEDFFGRDGNDSDL